VGDGGQAAVVAFHIIVFASYGHPAPLTLKQQHITAVEGIVPSLQNMIITTVILDCCLASTIV
jgi:hypothetical protein